MVAPILGAAARAALLLALPALAVSQPVTDDFEAPAISPAFWNVLTMNGSVALSTDQAHSGSQSVKFASTNGDPRGMNLWHTFPSPQKGLFTIWFYDFAPGSETLYQFLNIKSSTDPNKSAAIGVSDYDAYCYNAVIQDNGVFGPNANCGVYPQASTTSVARTPGWHRFDVNVLAASIELKIDGVTVYTRQTDLAFDQVWFSVSGPGWRPNTVAYVDDFSHTPLAAQYQVCLLYDQTKGVKSGATVPIRLQLCDAGGTNLSSAGVALHATGVVQVSNSAPAALTDTGNANPDDDFRYDPTVGGTGGYIFNLKTTGFATGTYKLTFTAGGGGTTYSAPFSVR